jgi:hypothetical protein
MLTRLAGAPAVLVAILALAACGGGEDETTAADFRKEYAPISAAVRGVGEDVGTAVSGAKDQTDATIAAEFGNLAAKTTSVAEELAGEQLPDDPKIKAARSALVSGLRKGAADLQAISAAAGAHDGAAAKAATERLVSDSTAIRDSRAELDELLLAAD